MKKIYVIILLFAGFYCLQAQTWEWSEDTLSYGRSGLSATIMDDSIFYSAGKAPYYSYPGIIDIYDIGEDSCDTYASESEGRWFTSAVSTNGMVFFAGGSDYHPENSWGFSFYIDVFTKETGEWTVEYLSESRQMIGTVAHGNKVFFAGGAGFGIYHDVIDIYDTETKAWLPSDLLSVKRSLIGAVTACGKLFFAGGATGFPGVTDVVDIYDTETGLWSVEYLSEARAYVGAVAYEGKVYFAGGALADNTSSDIIDIYNCEDETWEDIETLSEPRIVSAHNVYNALVFTGMCDYFDLETYTAYDPNGTVDIYYPGSGQWDYSVPDLDPARFYYADVSYDNRVYYAGGSTATNIINILDLSVGISEERIQQLAVSTYPNPFHSSFKIDYNLHQPDKVSIAIYNNMGERIEVLVDEYQQQGAHQATFNAGQMNPGVYFGVIKTAHYTTTKKIIKLN